VLENIVETSTWGWGSKGFVYVEKDTLGVGKSDHPLAKLALWLCKKGKGRWESSFGPPLGGGKRACRGKLASGGLKLD